MKLTKRQKEIFDSLTDDEPYSLWEDWKWQMKNSIKDLNTFESLFRGKFKEEKRHVLKKVINKFPIAITPYYLSLIDEDNIENDPIFIQSFPSPMELKVMDWHMSDPLDEDKDSPVPGITHRYPDRVLLLVSNVCGMYCRHCTRKRRVGDVDSIPSRTEIEAGINYIKNTPQIRDVLLSGGDPFLLSDDYLDWILTELTKIDHVEVIRIGTRVPVVLPQRITNSLVSVLKKHHPIWVNTHFNHPNEITKTSESAIAKLANAGIPLGNQSVLLAGINDCPQIMRSLVHKLVKNRIRPYYLYQCDLSEGLSHFQTPIGKGIEILENLIGHTSGFCVPTYVVDAPGGGGKIPIMPSYLISQSASKVILRNYEGVITTYQEPNNYKNSTCESYLELNNNDEETKFLGIQKLLTDYDSTISLVPANNERYARR